MLAAGRTPNLARWLPGGMWERRHTAGSFTYAAHHAFFAGFLPTPADPRLEIEHGRLFAARFAGSETTTERTAVFDTPAAFFATGPRAEASSGEDTPLFLASDKANFITRARLIN